MAAHFLHRNDADAYWADAIDGGEASNVDAAIYQVLMANYEATAEMIGFLDSIASGISNLESKLDKFGGTGA